MFMRYVNVYVQDAEKNAKNTMLSHKSNDFFTALCKLAFRYGNPQ